MCLCMFMWIICVLCVQCCIFFVSFVFTTLWLTEPYSYYPWVTGGKQSQVGS